MVQPNISVTLEKDDSPGLEDELVKVLMEEIRKEMDDEIMRKYLVDSGWTEVKMNYTSRQQAVDMIDWCMDTLAKDQWRRLNGCFVFRTKKEAEWFVLRWL